MANKNVFLEQLGPERWRFLRAVPQIPATIDAEHSVPAYVQAGDELRLAGRYDFEVYEDDRLTSELEAWQVAPFFVGMDKPDVIPDRVDDLTPAVRAAKDCGLGMEGDEDTSTDELVEDLGRVIDGLENVSSMIGDIREGRPPKMSPSEAREIRDSILMKIRIVQELVRSEDEEFSDGVEALCRRIAYVAGGFSAELEEMGLPDSLFQLSCWARAFIGTVYAATSHILATGEFHRYQWMWWLVNDSYTVHDYYLQMDPDLNDEAA